MLFNGKLYLKIFADLWQSNDRDITWLEKNKLKSGS